MIQLKSKKMNGDESSLFERLGGKGAVNATVDIFYKKDRLYLYHYL